MILKSRGIGKQPQLRTTNCPPKPEPGVFAIVRGIGARPGNNSLETRESIASQVTSQIVGPEINVTFRYNPKKLRRAWGISQVIINLTFRLVFKKHLDANQGKHGIAF